MSRRRRPRRCGCVRANIHLVALQPTFDGARSCAWHRFQEERHVFDKHPFPPRSKPRSKDSILQEADSMRALARRTRRLASEVANEADLSSLKRHIKELEDGAARLEKAAIDA